MKAEPRSSRFFWILGLLLLIGSIVGTGVVLNGVQGSASPGTADQATAAPQTHLAMCIGYVDCEFGISNLYPTQLGQVVEVRDEGEHVKKGDWLLKVDSKLAKLRLQEANAVFEEAKKLPDQHKLKLEQQDLAIKEAKQQKKVADMDFKIKKEGITEDFKKRLAVAEEELKRVEFKIAFEETKLRELNLANPALGLQRAKAVYDQAKLAVDECELRAPTDGTLLRSLVHIGETLGPNPKMPALQFAQDGKKIIRAEILQEWASKFKKDQVVQIEDDTYNGPKWTGTIKRVGNWYAQTRSIILEPFRMNDVRSLECIIEVNEKDDSLWIGQRVRVGLVK